MFDKFDEVFDKQYEWLNIIGYELMRLSEDTKVIKVTTNKFSSKLIYQERNIYTIATYF